MYGSSFAYIIGTFPRVMQRIIWSTKNFDGSRWRRVIITLPSDIEEYQLLLEGKCNKTSSYYNRNHVILNSLELQHCSTRGKCSLLIPCAIHIFFINALQDVESLPQRHELTKKDIIRHHFRSSPRYPDNFFLPIDQMIISYIQKGRQNKAL